MIRHGDPPYLECSTRGDLRFSAFVARIIKRDMRTIEEIYQSAKVFNRFLPGVDPNTGHMIDWYNAVGKKPLNVEEVSKLYDTLWEEYIEENPDLIKILIAVSGLTDMYGQEGHCCQATSLWKIRNKYFATR